MTKEPEMKQPKQVSKEVWQQHLNWTAVMSGQTRENITRFRAQIDQYGRIRQWY